MNELTLGYCLARSMSSSDFRRSVLIYHLIGEPIRFKCILEHNHFISVDASYAVLHRIVEDESQGGSQEGEDSEEETPRSQKKSKHSLG